MSYLEHVTSDHFEDPLAELARANRFTLADLEQSRNGKISDAQWMRLLLRCFVVKTFVPRIILWIMALKGVGVFFAGGVTLACVGAFLLSVLKSAPTMALLHRAQVRIRCR